MTALEKAARDREQEELFRRKQVKDEETDRERQRQRHRERVVGGNNVPWGSIEMTGPENAECFAFACRLKPKSMSCHSNIKRSQWRDNSCRGR